MSSLLDQSALTDLAERLVAAARRAGADAADALAVRSVSLAVEVRDGAVEESERSEGDDVGLRAFVGRRQAVVSTNDVKTDATELPALYEVKDGTPSLLNFQVRNGTYVVPKVLDRGYLALGKAQFSFAQQAR